MNDRALKVLEQYDLEILSTRRGRGSYICETTQGIRILSDYSGSENKARFQNCVMEKLRDSGYEKVDFIHPDKEGNLIVKDWENNKYVLKDWYVGRECDTTSESEILAAIENLAHLHRLMKLEEDNEYRENFTAADLRERISRWNAQLRKIHSFIRRKNDKCDFERLFLQLYDSYYAQAAEAEDWISGRAGSRHVKGVCHGDYNHHHVLICGYDIATTNFECCKFDDQIDDLYRFMRKILEKHDWNIRLGMRMLERYNQERQITGEERNQLQVKMLYPEKFRKLASQYYGSNKAWVSRRYMEKLQNLSRLEDKKREFIQMI